MTDPEWLTDMLYHEALLADLGLLEPGQPTEGAHIVHMRALRRKRVAEFTPQERAHIREQLGLWP